jgi:hypothetical protein
MIEAMKYAVAHSIASPINDTNTVNGNGTGTGPLTERQSTNPQSAATSAPRVTPIAEFHRGTYARKRTDEEPLAVFTRRKLLELWLREASNIFQMASMSD